MPGMVDEPREADEAGGEGDRDPGEIEDEEDEQNPFENGDVADRDDAEHFVGAI